MSFSRLYKLDEAEVVRILDPLKQSQDRYQIEDEGEETFDW